MHGISILSWLTLAFFSCQSGFLYSSEIEAAIQKIKTLNLQDHPTWKSLLHLKKNQPQIDDSNFLLSKENFSPQTELEATIRLLFKSPQIAYCRFPARVYFISNQLKYTKIQSDSSQLCPELEVYRDSVPFDELSIIFASEVLSSASSMMGHTFLRASGENIHRNRVSHSISFFSEIDTFNPFKLIYDGLISGLDGFILVRPFDKDINNYSVIEGRNLWSYSLDLNETQRELIKLHLWELKDIKINYLFQNYNCATVTLYLLSLANPSLKNLEKLYVSPLDVVKAASKYNMIKEPEVILANDWKLNMLSQEMSDDILELAQDIALGKAPLNLNSIDHHSLFYIKEYISLLLETPEFSATLGADRKSELSDLLLKIDLSDTQLALSGYKNPLDSHQDSVISAELIFDSEIQKIDFSFLPASHYLYSDNRRLFSESELKIGELTVRSDFEKKRLNVQSLTIYSVKSYTPSTLGSSHLSGDFFLGYHHLLNEDLEETGILELSGGAGKSFRPNRDIIFYAVLRIGAVANEKTEFIYIEPYIGFSANLIGNSKVILEYRSAYNQFDEIALKNSISLSYAWFGLKDKTVKLELKSTSRGKKKVSAAALKFDYHF